MNQICEHTESKQSKDQQAQTDCDENESRQHTGDHRGLSNGLLTKAKHRQKDNRLEKTKRHC